MKVCVDIGGTKVAVTLARSKAAGDDLLPGTRCAEPTAKTGPRDALAQQVLRLIDEACAKAEQQGVALEAITAVGVSSCGPFILNQGAVELVTPNICGGMAGPARGLPNNWPSAPLEAPVRAALQARLPAGARLLVRVENDGVSALEAERLWGALKGLDHCAYVTWSTGVGAGLCVDGQVLRGKDGNAGHIGHIFVTDDLNDDGERALCGCGNLGDVEALAAGDAMQRRWGLDTPTLMHNARSGDAAALAKVDQACRVMGRALYNLVVLMDLQCISLGGSVFLHNQDLLLPRLRAHIDGKLPALTKDFTLVPAGLGAQVGDYAALALVNSRETLNPGFTSATHNPPQFCATLGQS